MAEDTTDIDVRLKEALTFSFEGDAKKSLKELQILLDEVPENLKVRYELAMLQMMQGQHDKGCENLKYILERDPTNARALQVSEYC